MRSSNGEQYRFDLIHPIAMFALARTCDEGAKKYGDFNAERGMPVHSLLNRTLRHMFLYLAGDRDEPHLAHAMWGIMMAIASDALWPQLNHEHQRGVGCSLNGATTTKQDEFTKWKQALDGLVPDKPDNWDIEDLPEVSRILEDAYDIQEEGLPF